MSAYPITISDSFHQVYPHASVGILILENVSNPKSCPPLDEQKVALESSLRETYSDKAALRSLPTLQAYGAYYKRFKKSYHVLAQLESVIFNGRSLPNTAALVEAMFMAELKNMLLTAGHDLDSLQMPVRIDCAQEGLQYIAMNGSEQTLKAEDMYMADGQGIISSVIYGPDGRTRIGRETQRALFVVYAPAGIQAGQIETHFSDIQTYVKLFAPEMRTVQQEIF
jgi:DNA/RNA-binding domain of Phe-tRNA-synthetase-like protein